MLMYMTRNSTYNLSDIEAKEVERITGSSVWIKGRRSARWSAYECYHETWEAARDHLLSAAESHLQSVNKEQVRVANMVAAIKRLKKPEPS